MTKGQRIALMVDWWPKACAAQGWNKNDRALRMRVLGEAAGRGLSSASDLNNKDDIDRVKAHLAALADHLSPVVKHETPGEDRAVRLRWKIRAELLPCLAVYLNDECGARSAESKEAAEKYLAEIIRDKFQRGARHVSTRILTLDDLSAVSTDQRLSALDQLVITLTRTVQAKRKAAGDSIHTMKLKAGLECDCAQCKPRGMRIVLPAKVRETEPETEEVGDPF